MKSIEEMENDLCGEATSTEQILEIHLHLSARYLGNDKEKCSNHAKAYLDDQSELNGSEEKIKLVSRILDIAEAGMNPEDIGAVYLELGDLYRRNQLDAAYFYYNDALEIFNELNLSDSIAESYSKISYVYNKRGEYKESKSILEKALKLAKETDNEKIMSKCYTQMGEIHYYQGAFEDTLNYYLKSLKLDEESGDVKEISKGYNNIGTVYYRIRDFEKAEEYFSKSLEMKLTLPDNAGLAFSYNNLGAVNYILKRYDKSLEQYQKSLAIREKLNDVKGQAASCSNIGGVYFDLDNISEALKWFNRAFELSMQIGDKHNAALIIGNMANAYKELGDFEKAVECGELELKLAEELEELPLQNSACKTLCDVYEKMGNLKKALQFHKNFKYLSEEIYYNDSEKKISEIIAKYDVEKKERIAEIHRLKNVELVHANKVIQKKNEELQKYKDELLLINKILTHDIANDLSVIQSAMELYREKPEEMMLNEIEKRTARSIRTIREQRNLVSTLDSVNKLKSYTFDNIFKGLSYAHQQIEIKVNAEGKVFADEAIYSVFENLTNNAIIHGKASSINIDVFAKKNFYEIRFVDNGIGIPAEIQSKVFQEGYSFGESGNTGIGLHIVKNTIERYGGTITVEDNKPQGTAFVLTLRKAD